jgi:hypothetical protein
MMITTNGIAIQVVKTENTSPTYLRAAMAKKRQGLTAKNWWDSMGENLYSFRPGRGQG